MESSVVSTAFPTQKDLENTEKIIQILRKENRFPSEEENRKRFEVLAKLDGIIKDWVKKVCLKQVRTMNNARHVDVSHYYHHTGIIRGFSLRSRFKIGHVWFVPSWCARSWC